MKSERIDEINDNIIRRNDVFTVTFEDDESSETFRLVDSKKESDEVSIDSPLGKAVYQKKIGDKCSYSVNGTTISVIIKGKN